MPNMAISIVDMELRLVYTHFMISINKEEKTSARRKLLYAVKAGRLVRSETCEECEKKCLTHAHHADYSRPLWVKWLCAKCHGKVHRKNPRIKKWEIGMLMSRLGKIGGKARAQALSPERRKEIAINANKARWSKIIK